MNEPHLLRVGEAPAVFAGLIAACRDAGLRAGWLELTAADAPAPDPLRSATDAGALRAVAAGPGRTVAVKRLRGPSVVRDLLREHFLGCRLVLVRGEIDAPGLAPDGEDWRVSPAGEAARRLSTEQLVDHLRRPHPWPAAAPESR